MYKTISKEIDCPFFCSECVIVYHKHNHDRISIKDMIENIDTEWKTLISNFSFLNSQIENNYNQYQNITKYLDNLKVQGAEHFVSLDI